MNNIFNMFKRRSKSKHENNVVSTYKEVKRKARKGEWVKITNPQCGIALHYKGEIVQIIDNGGFFHNYKGVFGVYAGVLYTDEYVVLEGYNWEGRV